MPEAFTFPSNARKQAMPPFIHIKRIINFLKGANMKTHMQSGTWIFTTAVVLAVIFIITVIGIIVLALTNHPMPGLLVALGWISAAGLAKVMVSPLSWGL
jgi:hypothetical protein